MGEKCFVVERNKLEGTGFLAQPGECKLTRLTSKNMPALKDILLGGMFRDRKGEHNVEEDPSYKQIIPYLYVVDSDNRFLIYQRNVDTAHYKEERLSGKVSLGIGGHMNEKDMMEGLFREFNEEAELLVNGQKIEFENGNVGLSKFNSMLNPQLMAVIDDRRDLVGEVHLGIVVAIRLRPDYLITMKNGESTRFEYVTLTDYALRKESGGVNPEGWTDIVVRKILSLSRN